MFQEATFENILKGIWELQKKIVNLTMQAQKRAVVQKFSYLRVINVLKVKNVHAVIRRLLSLFSNYKVYH